MQTLTAPSAQDISIVLNPNTATRLLKAAALVEAGAVEQGGRGEDPRLADPRHFYVLGTCQPVYFVSLFGDGWCNCADFTRRRSDCKHILAARLTAALHPSIGLELTAAAVALLDGAAPTTDPDALDHPADCPCQCHQAEPGDDVPLGHQCPPVALLDAARPTVGACPRCQTVSLRKSDGVAILRDNACLACLTIETYGDFDGAA